MYSPATAIEETWCRRSASIARASSTACVVPPTLTAVFSSARRRHVVDGGEMEEVLDLAAQLGDLLLLDAEQRAAQVADDRLHAFAGGRAGDDAPALDQVVEALQRGLAHEHVDLALAFVEQLLDEAAPDEAGRSCDEVGHRAAEPT